MIRKPLALLAASLLAGCTSQSENNAEMITSSDGQAFLVEHTEWPAQRFPSNNDLKMVDGDLTRYGADLCGIPEGGGSIGQDDDTLPTLTATDGKNSKYKQENGPGEKTGCAEHCGLFLY